MKYDYSTTASLLGITTEKYIQSVQKSLVNKGNLYLLQKLLEKLKAGNENITIAAIGGSVTEGAGPKDSQGNELWQTGYAFEFAQRFAEKYAGNPSKVILNGAGLSGTPSALGCLRYEQHVVKTLGTEPDLLIIEFAVNDYLECSNTRGFEYMIRHALSKGTAVIALYAAATYGNMAENMSPVADFYNIPQINILSAFEFSGIDGTKGSNVFYTDEVHPVKAGHTFMTDCLLNLFETALNEAPAAKYEIPESFKNKKPFVSFTTLDNSNCDKNVKIISGSFASEDTFTQSLKKGGTAFPKNWQHISGTETFKLNLKCKGLMLVYKDSNEASYGTADFIIDGKTTVSFNGCDGKGWNNCVTVMLIDEETAENHTIEVKMAAGDENKKFTICAFGYSL